MGLLHATSAKADAFGDLAVARRFLQLNHRCHPANERHYLDAEEPAPCSWQEAWHAYLALQGPADRERYQDFGHDVVLQERFGHGPGVIWENQPLLDWRAVALWVAGEAAAGVLEDAWDGRASAGLATEVVEGQRHHLIADLLKYFPDRVDPYAVDSALGQLAGLRLLGRPQDCPWDAQPVIEAVLDACGRVDDPQLVIRGEGPELADVVGARFTIVFKGKPPKKDGADCYALISKLSAKAREDYRLSAAERGVLGWTSAPDYQIEIYAGSWLAMHGWMDPWGRRYAWPLRLLHHELLHCAPPRKAGGAWRLRTHTGQVFGAELARYGATSFEQAEVIRAGFHHPETQRLLSLAEQEHDFKRQGGEHVRAPQKAALPEGDLFRGRTPPELQEVLDLAETVADQDELPEEGVDFVVSVQEQAEQLRARVQDGERWTEAMSRSCASWRGGLNKWAGEAAS